MKYPLLTLLIILTACANQTAPTGGPKDETPPNLTASNPSDQSINVETDEIELEFDEFVKLDKAKEQIIISPNFETETQFIARKNKVYIKFNKNLPDSTTFTINFRESIKDITEGNSPQDLKIAFSTGSYLDSLTISGEVRDLLTDQPSKDYSIFLYNSLDTLNIFEDSPLYFTKSNKDGKFKFENIKEGSYNIYAVHDTNKNLKLDFKSEAYAFIDSTLLLSDSINNLLLSSYYFNIDSNTLKSARQNGTIYELKFSKYITDYHFKNQDSITIYSNFIDKEQKSLQIYNYQLSNDSIQTIIQYTDSTNITNTDTLIVKFEETIRTPKDLKQEVRLNKVFPSDGILTGNIEFNKPIISINYDSIYLYLDSLNIIQLDSTNITSNKFQDKFNLSYIISRSLFEPKETANTNKETKDIESNIKRKTDPNQANNSPHLYIGRGAFISVEQDSSSNKRTNLSFTRLEDYGIILLDIKTQYKNYYVQLLDKDFKIIQEQPGEENIKFNKVSPGDYIIRVMVDLDQSGNWDMGNINFRQTPEPVYFYTNENSKKEITIRANWELGPLLLEF